MLTCQVSDGRCSGRISLGKSWNDDDESLWSKPIVYPPRVLWSSGKLPDLLAPIYSHCHTPTIRVMVMEVMVAWCTLQYHQIYLEDLSFLLCFLNVKAVDNNVTMTNWIPAGLTLGRRSGFFSILLFFFIIKIMDSWLFQTEDGAELRPLSINADVDDVDD